MSNQCSNLFNCRSFSLRIPFRTPLKPYSTTVRPIFSFHSNFVLTGRRSRSRSSSLPPPLPAQSSSDIVLIATTEHLDGSLVFQFGDASEVVKNDDIVKELGSQDEQDSDVLNVSEGDQERQVIDRTIERGNEKSGRITEAADGIRNADLDGDIAEREANVISDLKDCQAEVSDGVSDISVEEVTSYPSDAEMNHSLEGVESIDRTECSTELDGDESSNTNISVLDKGPNSDKSAYSEGTLLKDGRDETNDPSLSVKLESRQVSQNEVMDVRKPYAEDDLDKVEAEDAVRSDTEDLMTPATHVNMSTSDVELTDAANENVEEILQDLTINKDTLIDEMPPSYLLGAELTSDKVRERRSENLKVEVTMDVSSTKAMNPKDQDMEDELHQANTNNRDESDVAYVMPVSSVKEAEPNVEEQVSDIVLQDTTCQNLNDVISQVGNEDEDSSVSVNLETMQVSHTEDTCEGDMKDLQSLATMLNSDDELMDTANEHMDEGLQDMNISENTLINILEAKAAKPTLDEVSQIQPSDFKLETTMEVSSTKSMDVNDQAIEDELQQMSTENQEKNVAFVKPVSLVEEPEEFVEEEVSHPQSNPLEVKPAMKVSDIQNTVGQNLDDEILEVGNEREDSSVSVELQTTQVSHIEVMDVTQPYADDKLHKVENEDTSGGDSEDLLPPATMHISDVGQTEATTKDMEEGLQDMNISEGVLLEGMLLTNSLGVEQTLDEVSQLQSSNADPETTMDFLTTGRMYIEDLAVDNELQQVSTDNRDANDVGNVTIAESDLEEEVNPPLSTPVEIKPSLQASNIEVPDATCQNLDDGILQIIDEREHYNMLENYSETDALESLIQLKQAAHDPLLETERTEGEVSSSKFNEASEDTESLLASKAKVAREDIYLTGYFLSSGAALLEHQFKALTGGDDAYFVAGSKWLGVANGVNQWSFEGSGPGVYAQELMRTCEEIALDTSSLPMTNPVELICRGVKETNISGSSNILIASFDGQALHVANIGDTGFLVIRHGAIYKKSSPLLHEFHFALQVEDSDDPLQLVEEYRIELDEGDIVVSATDGLFDNLYEREIAMIVSKSLQAGIKPQEIANLLATRAQEVGRSAFVRSPFSDAAQAAGYTGYAGGKPDNVAVIVSLVEKISNILSK